MDPRTFLEKGTVATGSVVLMCYGISYLVNGLKDLYRAQQFSTHLITQTLQNTPANNDPKSTDEISTAYSTKCVTGVTNLIGGGFHLYAASCLAKDVASGNIGRDSLAVAGVVIASAVSDRMNKP